MTDNIEKVRELLFGDQMKALEQQLSDLENQLMQRLDNVQGSLDQKAEQLNRQLELETGERNSAIDSMEKSVKALFANLSGELSAIREQNDRHFAESRSTLDSQIRKIESEIQEQRAQLQQSLDESVRGLDNDKISRDRLSELFGNLSQMLRTGNKASE